MPAAGLPINTTCEAQLNTRKWVLIGAGVWFGLGLAALAVTKLDLGAGYLLVILPAIPLYLMATSRTAGETGGYLWDSAHAAPFLTPAGIIVVYFLPALLALGWILSKGTSHASRRGCG